MSLTRKRQKELKRLRSSAEELWGQQQDVLSNANALAAEARKQAAYYTREEIAPRVREGYDSYVRPAAQSARDTAGKYAGVARDRLVGDVIPAVGTAVGTALSVVDHARAARAQHDHEIDRGRARHGGDLVGRALEHRPARVREADPCERARRGIVGAQQDRRAVHRRAKTRCVDRGSGSGTPPLPGGIRDPIHASLTLRIRACARC